MTYNFVLNFKSFMVIQNYNIWLKYILMWKHKSKNPLIIIIERESICTNAFLKSFNPIGGINYATF